jgi:hypothetical protein
MTELNLTSGNLCEVCGEPDTRHVPTEKGPMTHPREARGEGTYRLKERRGYGLSCPFVPKGQLCYLCLENQGHPVYVFEPAKS